jgi:hypothetical protein
MRWPVEFGASSSGLLDLRMGPMWKANSGGRVARPGCSVQDPKVLYLGPLG